MKAAVFFFLALLTLRSTLSFTTSLPGRLGDTSFQFVSRSLLRSRMSGGGGGGIRDATMFDRRGTATRPDKKILWISEFQS